MLCNGSNIQLTIKHNGYFTFHMIIDIAGERGTISSAVCVGSPVMIIISKKLTKKLKYTGIFN